MPCRASHYYNDFSVEVNDLPSSCEGLSLSKNSSNLETCVVYLNPRVMSTVLTLIFLQRPTPSSISVTFGFKRTIPVKGSLSIR
jgi:hypothetical protein